MIVEVQLHVRDLFELKSDLHVLYGGARVLGAMDDVMVKHDGLLTAEALERASRGVVRKLICASSAIEESAKDQLAVLVRREPCALLEIDLTSCKVGDAPAFDGWTISRVLEPTTGTLACRRLRILRMSGVGLMGEVPECLSQMRSLTDLRLATNRLTGRIPGWLGQLTRLEVLMLGGNQLEGEIPPELFECKRLSQIFLERNQLSGAIPEAIGQLVALQDLTLFGNQLSGVVPHVAMAQLTKLRKLLLCSNPGLTITAEGEKLIMDAVEDKNADFSF